ncbi:MAG TPA: hypothetical protein VF444_15210, partial [Pseudonocardiaceae bacterium]
VAGRGRAGRPTGLALAPVTGRRPRTLALLRMLLRRGLRLLGCRRFMLCGGRLDRLLGRLLLGCRGLLRLRTGTRPWAGGRPMRSWSRSRAM